MSYEFYKIFHLSCVVLFTASTTAILYGQQSKKSCKIFNGVASFLLFVAGMGLLARIGYTHGASWPIWAYIKIGLWLAATVWSASAAKRLPEHKTVVSSVFLILILSAVITAVLRPWE